MLALIATGVIVLIIWGALKAGGWAAANPTIIAAGLFTIAFIWLVFYHRRRMAQIEALDIDTRGRFTRVNRATPWPRWCRWCGATVPGPRAHRIHNDPDSHCSRAALGADRQADDTHADLAAKLADIAAQPTTWTATAEPGPAGGLDTFTDDPAALEGAREEAD